MNPRRLLSILAATFIAAGALRAELTEEIAKKLFSPDATLEAFNKAVDEATKAGAPAQFIAEAKLVWGLRNKDTEFLTKIVPELESVAKDYKEENSAGLGTVEDFQALIHYVKALDAAMKGDSAKVKEHITEAFWLSPEQSGLFAQTVTFFRTQAKMAKITVDMKTKITNSKAEGMTLEQVLGKNKAILLDFWASWCGPCVALMPQLKKKSEYLAKYGVVVAGMNAEGDPAIAEKFRIAKEMKDVVWLVEPTTEPFSKLLDIKTLPRMVLLTPEGKVLFNGSPMDPALWAALKNVDPAIQELKMEPPTAAEPEPAKDAGKKDEPAKKAEADAEPVKKAEKKTK